MIAFISLPIIGLYIIWVAPQFKFRAILIGGAISGLLLILKECWKDQYTLTIGYGKIMIQHNFSPYVIFSFNEISKISLSFYQGGTGNQISHFVLVDFNDDSAYDFKIINGEHEIKAFINQLQDQFILQSEYPDISMLNIFEQIGEKLSGFETDTTLIKIDYLNRKHMGRHPHP